MRTRTGRLPSLPVDHVLNFFFLQKPLFIVMVEYLGAQFV